MIIINISGKSYCTSVSECFLSSLFTLRKESSAPFSMYSTTIMTGLPGGKMEMWHQQRKRGTGLKKRAWIVMSTDSSWPLPPAWWCWGCWTGPWWKLRVKTPASAVLCSRPSASLWPRRCPSFRVNADGRCTPHQTHLPETKPQNDHFTSDLVPLKCNFTRLKLYVSDHWVG